MQEISSSEFPVFEIPDRNIPYFSRDFTPAPAYRQELGRQPLCLSPPGLFNQDGDRPSEESRREPAQQFVPQENSFFTPCLYHGLAQVPFHRNRSSTGTPAVGENMELAEAKSPGKIQGSPEGFVGFSRKTNQDVGREVNISWPEFPDPFNDTAETCGIVTSPHRRKNPIVPALHGDMKVRAEPGGSRQA